MTRMILPLLAALAVLLPTTAHAATKQFASCKAQGDFAICSASGSVDNPHKLLVRVTSTPHQKAEGNYTVVCSKGTGAGSKSGDFKGTTPFTRIIRHPFFRPDSCSAAGLAELAKGGHLKVVLLVVR